MNLKNVKKIILILSLLLIISSCVKTKSPNLEELNVPETADENANIPTETIEEPVNENTESEETIVEEIEELPAPEEIPEVIEETPEIPEQIPQTIVTSEFTIPPLGGNTYYISTSGNNENPGTREQPWAKPSYGVGKLQPGDTLIILGGKYVLSDFGEDILRVGSGTANAWIAIKGEEGNRPILAGRNNLLTAIDIPDAHNVWIDNLEITSDNGASFRDGIEGLSGNLNHVILSNLYIHHIDEFGINVADADDLKMINNQIVYTGLGGVGGPEGRHGGWRNVLIKGGSLSYNGHYYQGKVGPSPFDRPDGFGIEPSDGPIEIADIMVEHNLGDGLDSKARNTYIHDCTVANNFADNIKLWGTGSRVENCLIYGRGNGNAMSTPWSSVVIDTTDDNARFEFNSNTIDSEADQSYLFGAQYDFNAHHITLTMNNNIFSSRGNNVPMTINSNVALTANNNVFWFPDTSNVLEYNSVRQYTSADISQLGSGNVYANPLFVKTGFGAEGDYHLQSNSPAKNSGKTSLR